MMTQTIIVLTLVTLAGLYVARMFIRQAKGSGGGGSGCSCGSGCGCSSQGGGVKTVDILDSIDALKGPGNKRGEK